MSTSRPDVTRLNSRLRKPRRAVVSAAYRAKLIRFRSIVESLEDRALMTIYQPLGVGLLSPTPVENVAFTGATVATFVSDAPLLTDLSATVDWGDGNGPVAATVSATGGQVYVPGVGNIPQYAVTGGTTYPNTSLGALVPIAVTLADSNDGTSAQVFDSTAVADAPLVDTGAVISPINVAEGSSVTAEVAQFHDGGTLTGDYTGTINWGDGTPADPNVSFVSLGGGDFSVQGTHVYTTPGQYTVTADVVDSGGSTFQSIQTNLATVTDAALTPSAPPTINAVSGAPLVNIEVGTFTDANPLAVAGDFSATIIWGDGSPDTAGVVVKDASGVFHVLGSHTYTGAGTYAVQASITDVTSTTLINPIPTGNVTVADSSLVPYAGPLAFGENATVPAGTTIGTFVDNGGPQSASVYTASAIIGGVFVPLTVTQQGTSNSYILTTTSSFSAGAPGLSSYSLHVTSSLGSTADTVGSVTITDAPLINGGIVLPQSVTEGNAATFDTAVFADNDPFAVAGDYTGTINWGDGTPDDPNVTFTSLGGGLFFVQGEHTYLTPGIYTVATTVRDFGGSVFQVIQSELVTVDDAALTPNAPPAINAVVGAPLTNVEVGSFTDADPLAVAGDFSATIIWGDGSPDSAGIVVKDASGTFHVLGSHIYQSSGSYAVQVNVTDVTSTTLINPIPTSNVTVADSSIVPYAVPLTFVEGSTVPAGTFVGTFVDNSGANSASSYDLAYAIIDGQIVPLTVSQQGSSNSYLLTTANSFVVGDEGISNYTINVASSTLGSSAVTAGLLTLTDAPLSLGAMPAPIVTTAGAAVMDAPLITFTDPANEPASDFTAWINWGDGTPSSIGTVNLAAGVYTVTGSHTYAMAGALYSITVHVIDDGGSAITGTNSATVDAAAITDSTPVPVVGTQGTPLANVTVATFVDANPSATASQFIATIDWGAGPTTATVTLLGAAPGGGSLFAISGSHLFTSEGVFPVSVVVADAAAPLVTTTISTSAAINQTPISVNVLPQATSAGMPIGPAAVIATFTNSGGPLAAGIYTATVDWGDGTSDVYTTFSDLGGGTFAILGGHTYTLPGVYAIHVEVDNADPATGFGGALAYVATGSVSGSLSPAPGAPTSATEGQPLVNAPIATFVTTNLTAPASEFLAMIDWGDGSPQSVGTVIPDPAFPPGTGHFLITGNHTYTEETPPLVAYNVTVILSDTFGGMARSESMVVTAVTLALPVVDAALVNPVGIPITVGVNNTLNNAPLGTFADDNPLATAADFTALINWGDGSPSSQGFVTLFGGNGTQAFFSVAGTHTYATSGPKNVSILVIDAGGQSTAITTTITVVSSPLSVTVLPIAATEGISTPGSVLIATFTAGNNGDPASSYTASIDWGDGSPLSPAASIILSGGVYSVFAPSHTYAEEGNYVVHVTISDLTDPTVSVTGGNVAYVKDAALTADPTQPVVNAMQGNAFVAMQVAKFTDGNPLAPLSDFSATIDWGDGTPMSAGTIIQPGGPGTAFYVVGNHTYTQPTTPPASPYTVRVTILDEGGSTLVTTTQANVQASTITVTPTTINGTESMPVINAIVGYFTDSGVAGPLSSYSATIDWGDGSPIVPGFIVPVGGNQFAVEGTHTYAEENTPIGTPYVVTVNLTHNGLPAPTITSHASINDAPLAGVALPVYGAVEGAQYKGAVAFFTDADPNGIVSDYTATITWGDGTSSSGTIVASGGGFLVMAADPVSGLGHLYAEDGSYTFSVRIRDVGGSEVQVFGTAVVADAPLSVGLLQPPVNATEGTSFTLPVASFTDANPTAPLSDFTANIDWGDGTPRSAGTISQSGGVGTPFLVTGSHNYINPTVNGGTGRYTILVNVYDVGGASVQVTNTANVQPQPFPLSGQLNPSSDSGLSQFDAVTNVNQPSFYGQTEPYSTVQLFAVPEGTNTMMFIGEGQSDGSGAWNVTTSVLPDGRYSVVMRAINRSGVYSDNLQILPNNGQGMLMIDTVSPKITNVDFNRIYGQVIVTFQDNLSGMDMASVSDAANYSLTKPHTRPGSFLVNVISVTGGQGNGPVVATLSINNGRQIRGGSYTLTVRGVGNSPVRDVAGNNLDGVFYGYYPSGNNGHGSNFVAILDAIHHRIYAPRTIVGHASPVKPPGTPATGRILQGNANPNTSAGNPGIFHPAALHARSVHDAALTALGNRKHRFHK